MRATAVLIALLFVFPVAASLALPLPRADLDVPTIEEVKGDITDARLVYLLGTEVGFDLQWPPARVAVPTLPLSSVALGMGLRAGMPVTVADVAAFDTLDPRISTPVAHLLAAMDAAWTLRDVAFARLTEAEQIELAQLTLDHDLDNPRYTELRANVDFEAMYDAAILLLDTLENVVLPQLRDAAQLDIWPAIAVADPVAPVGVLRIGSTGNDEEHTNRILQIDPRGDDIYRNNAGGGTILAGLGGSLTEYRTPVALSIDLSGGDQYRDGRNKVTQGGGLLGIGILYDLQGNDFYDCYTYCQGGGGNGIGIARDFKGNDIYLGSDRSNGGGDTLGILREENGNDGYWVNEKAGGYAIFPTGVGLFWDRGGTDAYRSRVAGFADLRYGWADQSARGWFVDEGPDNDQYDTADPIYGQYAHGCNDCEWEKGTGFNGLPAAGRGNDNNGGLYRILQQTQQSYS